MYKVMAVLGFRGLGYLLRGLNCSYVWCAVCGWLRIVPASIKCKYVNQLEGTKKRTNTLGLFGAIYVLSLISSLLKLVLKQLLLQINIAKPKILLVLNWSWHGRWIFGHPKPPKSGEISRISWCYFLMDHWFCIKRK